MDVRESLRAVRASFARGPAELRRQWWPLAQIALAAGIAWQLADLVPGHRAGIFAPIIAAVALGAGPGQRGSQAVEFIVGVGLGILLGDLVAWLLGGGTWQLVVATALGLSVATALGLSGFVALQTGISALIVVGLHPGDPELVPGRMIDAAVGAGVALVFSQLLFPADPVRLAADAAERALEELAGGFERIARALRERDEAAMHDVLASVQRIDDRGLRDALGAARAIVRRAPRRRAGRGRLRAYERIAGELDTTGRDGAVLAMGSIRMLRSPEGPPEGLADAVDMLGDAVRAVADSLRDHGGAIRAHRAALVGARRGHLALAGRDGLAAEMLRSQIESLARDVLRSCGADDEAAAEAVREAREGAPHERAGSAASPAGDVSREAAWAGPAPVPERRRS